MNDQGLFEAIHERSGLRFVLVPGGEFDMGATEGGEDERPVHGVRVAAFLLAKTPCTQAAWDRVGGTDNRRWDGPERPIEMVGWRDVLAWCWKAGTPRPPPDLSRAAALRLPSEAEWEYACRAGTRTAWCCGDDASRLVEYAWFEANSGSQTGAVAQLAPNAWGLHDMHGLVWEWCADSWDASYDAAPSDGTARVVVAAPARTIRGGSLGCPASTCRSAARSSFPTELGCCCEEIGFRPAASLPWTG